MTPTLADFPVTRKWPPKHPDRIQLYSLPTPNGVKVSIAGRRPAIRDAAPGGPRVDHG